jgi:ankyrin repeat protein
MVRLLRKHGARLTLTQAAELQDSEALTALLKAGVPADQEENDRPMALSIAANLGQMEMILQLLAHGADVNGINPQDSFPRTALGYAAASGRLDVIQLLLNHGATVHPETGVSTPLEDALLAKQIAAVRLLLAHGADPNFHSHERRYAYTLSAAIENMPEVMPDLLARGADINAGHGQPLLTAIHAHRPDLVQELLRRGAKARFSPEETKRLASDSSPPFVPVIEAIRDAPECVEMLLKAGADIDAADQSGETALTQAIIHAPAQVKTLLEHGANVHVVTQTQHTPLDLAAAQGDVKNVGLLLAQGAEVNARPPRGHTPLYWARAHHHPAVVRLLQNTGARDD